MGRDKARKLIESGVVTVGYLRKVIDETDRKGNSKLNKAFTKEQVIKFYLAGLRGHDEDKVVMPKWSLSYNSGLYLGAMNALRDCA